MREKVDDLLSLCEVEHAFTQNKNDFAADGVDLLLGTLLKEKFEYQVEESEMGLALGALKAAIDTMGLLQLG